MSALAGFSVAAFSEGSKVVITEGNPQCVENIQCIIDENSHTFKSKHVTCKQLLWSEEEEYKGEYDMIIVADCLYEESLHKALLNVMNRSLFEGGKAYILAPPRGGR